MSNKNKLTKDLIKDISAHAESSYPEECCGVVVLTESGKKYIPCSNKATNPTQDFSICPIDKMNAEKQGEVVGIVHSHPDAEARPSKKDLAVLNTHYAASLSINPDYEAIPWHIISWPQQEITTTFPNESVPLQDRPFIHNYWDCWQVCADYYEREYGLTFPRWQREDLWWEKADGPSHYEDLFPEAGFDEVSLGDIQRGDIVIMQIGRTYHPNHAAIYLDTDPSLPNEETNIGGPGPFILHHMYGRKSGIEVFGGQWEQRTRLVLRHRSLMNAPEE